MVETQSNREFFRENIDLVDFAIGTYEHTVEMLKKERDTKNSESMPITAVCVPMCKVLAHVMTAVFDYMKENDGDLSGHELGLILTGSLKEQATTIEQQLKVNVGQMQ